MTVGRPPLKKDNDKKVLQRVLFCLNQANSYYMASCLLHQQSTAHPFGLLLFQFVGVPPWLLPYGRMANHDSRPNDGAGAC